MEVWAEAAAKLPPADEGKPPVRCGESDVLQGMNQCGLLRSRWGKDSAMPWRNLLNLGASTSRPEERSALGSGQGCGETEGGTGREVQV